MKTGHLLAVARMLRHPPAFGAHVDNCFAHFINLSIERKAGWGAIWVLSFSQVGDNPEEIVVDYYKPTRWYCRYRRHQQLPY